MRSPVASRWSASGGWPLSLDRSLGHVAFEDLARDRQQATVSDLDVLALGEVAVRRALRHRHRLAIETDTHRGRRVGAASTAIVQAEAAVAKASVSTTHRGHRGKDRRSIGLLHHGTASLGTWRHGRIHAHDRRRHRVCSDRAATDRSHARRGRRRGAAHVRRRRLAVTPHRGDRRSRGPQRRAAGGDMDLRVRRRRHVPPPRRLLARDHVAIAVPVALVVRTWWVGSPQGWRIVVFLAVGLAFTLLFLSLGRALVAAFVRTKPVWRRRP